MFEKNSENSNSIEKSEIEKVVHASGRESDVIIERKDKIGKGSYGDVYRANISLVSDEDKIKKLKEQYIVKEFRDVNHVEGFDGIQSDESRAEKALMKHKALKNAGVDTWPTFRRIENREAVLMTDGENEGSFLISASDASKSKDILLRHQYEIIENLKEVVQSAIENALSAGQVGIIIPGDAWFASFRNIPEPKKLFANFRTPKNSGKIEKIFVGDLDQIKINMLEKYSAEAVEIDNLTQLNDFFNELFSQITGDSAFFKYRKIAQKLIGHKATKIDASRWKKYLNRPFDKNDEYDEMGKDHINFKE